MHTASSFSPRVSVVIPGYKSRYILETIASVRNQTFAPYEIIVVDDGSPHDLKTVLRDLVAEGAIRYIHQENKKMAAAKNTGIRNSLGELIAFIDDDDLWMPDKLEKQVPLFRNPEVGLAYTWAEGLLEVEAVPLPFFRFTARGHIFEEIVVDNRIPSSSTMVRRACFDEVNPFNESPEYFGVDDGDLWARISHRYLADYVPEVLLKIRMHPERFSSQSGIMERNDLFVRERLIRELGVSRKNANRFFARIFFDMGFGMRRKDRIRAFGLYFKSLYARPSFRTMKAMVGLLRPGSSLS